MSSRIGRPVLKPGIHGLPVSRTDRSESVRNFQILFLGRSVLVRGSLTDTELGTSIVSSVSILWSVHFVLLFPSVTNESFSRDQRAAWFDLSVFGPIGISSANPFPEAYFVILEFDSHHQINRHHQARCRTYPVLLKIRLRWFSDRFWFVGALHQSVKLWPEIYGFENQPEYSLDSFSSYEIPVTFESLLDSENIHHPIRFIFIQCILVHFWFYRVKGSCNEISSKCTNKWIFYHFSN